MNEQSLINRAEEVVEAYAAGDLHELEVEDLAILIADMLENLRELRN